MKRVIIVLSTILLFEAASLCSWAGQTEIGGQYRIMANASNFSWHQLTFGNNEKPNAFINQRFRVNFNSIFDEKTKAHVQVQFNTGPGGDLWGDGTSPKRGKFALRHAYLNFKVGNFDVNAGIQDWSDGFGDVLASGDWDFNAGGVIFTRKVEEFELRFGALKLQEGDSREADDSELYVADANFFWGGIHAYYVHDKSIANQTETNLWTGVTVNKKIGSAALNTFFIYNYGTRDIYSTDFNHSGYAAKIEGTVNFQASNFAVQALYSSGNNGNDTKNTDEFRTLQDDGQGYWSYLGLFTPRGSSDVHNLRASLRNRDQEGIARGLTTFQANASFPILENRMSGYVAAGLFRATERDANGNNNLGTELLAESKYMITQSLGIEFGIAYAFLGDFYKTSQSTGSPNNIYEFFSRLQVEF